MCLSERERGIIKSIIINNNNNEDLYTFPDGEETFIFKKPLKTLPSKQSTHTIKMKNKKGSHCHLINEYIHSKVHSYWQKRKQI